MGIDPTTALFGINNFCLFTDFFFKQIYLYLHIYLIYSQFWNIVESLSDEQKRKFLLFVTGSDRVPVGGMGDMNFKITRGPNRSDYLPEAHTCFNQLVLPQYSDHYQLKEKLVTAILNSEGFGME